MEDNKPGAAKRMQHDTSLKAMNMVENLATST